MDWLPTTLSKGTLPLWCFLQSTTGETLFQLVGFGGLISTLVALWTLPSVETSIITERNKKKRYRSKTRTLGWVVIVLLAALPVANYSILESEFGELCKVDDPTKPRDRLAIFLAASSIALILFAWFHARAHKVRSENP
jgi:hypothetical protein